MRLTKLQKISWLAKYFTWIFRHPLNRRHPFSALRRYLGWQLGSRLLGYPVVYPFVNDLKVEIATGMWGATGIVYFGLEEYPDMAFCAHVLRPGDLFVDVGACFGSYTLLASGVAGARSVAFEPNPRNSAQIDRNVRLNRLEGRVRVHASAVGATSGAVRMTGDLQGANHVLTDGAKDQTAIQVPLMTLDEALSGTEPTLIKIDVEGYEQAVLDGATNVLKSPSLLGVIMEDVGFGGRYQASSGQHERMLQHGFRSFRYCPERRELEDLHGQPNRNGMNTLYIRSPDRVRERVTAASPITVRDQRI